MLEMLNQNLVEIAILVLSILISMLGGVFKKHWKKIMEKFKQVVELFYLIDELEDVQSEILDELKTLLMKISKKEEIGIEEYARLLSLLQSKGDKVKKLRGTVSQLVD